MWDFLKATGAIILFLGYLALSIFLVNLLWLAMLALQKYLHG